MARPEAGHMYRNLEGDDAFGTGIEAGRSTHDPPVREG
jgi:hypothetical protein